MQSPLLNRGNVIEIKIFLARILISIMDFFPWQLQRLNHP